MSHQHETQDSAATTRATPGRSAGPAVPRPLRLGPAATPASVLNLQRLAGNAAVQRAVAIDDVSTTVDTAGPAAPQEATAATAGGAPAAPGAAPASLGDGSSPVAINGTTVGVHAPMMQVDGVVRASTIIADSVVASNYTPGAGNVW